MQAIEESACRDFIYAYPTTFSYHKIIIATKRNAKGDVEFRLYSLCYCPAVFETRQ